MEATTWRGRRNRADAHPEPAVGVRGAGAETPSPSGWQAYALQDINGRFEVAGCVPEQCPWTIVT